MQLTHFPLGRGYVIHGMLRTDKRRVSAWFKDDGTMTDAEFLLANGRARAVKRDGPTWREAQRIGRIYAALEVA